MRFLLYEVPVLFDESLQLAGHATLRAETFNQLCRHAKAEHGHNQDVILVGLESEGRRLVSTLRSHNIWQPILGICDCSSLPSFSERAAFIDLGGDDLFPSRISINALVMTAAARSRLVRMYRTMELPPLGVTLFGGRVVAYPERMAMTVDGEPFHFPKAELQIFLILAARPNMVHSRDSIINMTNARRYRDERTIDAHIGRMRIRFDERLTGLDAIIETHWGLGYSVSSTVAPS